MSISSFFITAKSLVTNSVVKTRVSCILNNCWCFYFSVIFIPVNPLWYMVTSPVILSLFNIMDSSKLVQVRIALTWTLPKAALLQIRRINMYNSGIIFFIFLHWNIFCDPSFEPSCQEVLGLFSLFLHINIFDQSLNCLTETVQMMGHAIVMAAVIK